MKNGILIFIATLLLFADVVIVADVPFLRQIMGFVLLTFIPGYLILRILHLGGESPEMSYVYSIGVSISLIMFTGLMLSVLSDTLQIAGISLTTLLFLFNFIIIALLILVSRDSDTADLHQENTIPRTLKEIISNTKPVLLVAPIIFPVLSIIGSYFMLSQEYNGIYYILIFLIAVYIVCFYVFYSDIDKRAIPWIIYLIAISLIIMKALTSSYVIGIDAHHEYYHFQNTLINGGWSLQGGTVYDACLSISVLPAVYQSFMQTDSQMFFNIFYVLLYTTIPIIVFLLTRDKVGYFGGSICAFFLITQHGFINSTAYARTIVAVLFFALTILTLFNSNFPKNKRTALALVFITSCIVSHYTTTYIFFMIFAGTMVVGLLLHRKISFKQRITPFIIIVFFAVMIIWYYFVTGVPAAEFTAFLQHTYTDLTHFSDLASRGTAGDALGQSIMEKGIPNKIEFVLTWLLMMVMAFGLMLTGLLFALKKIDLFHAPAFIKDSLNCFLNIGILHNTMGIEYFVLSVFAFFIILSTIVVPYIAIGYDIFRVCAMLFPVLALYFAIGGNYLSISVVDLIKKITHRKFTPEKKEKSRIIGIWIILLILPLYLFFITGIAYDVSGSSLRMYMDHESLEYRMNVISEYDYHTLGWLNTYSNRTLTFHSDLVGERFSVSQMLMKPLTVDTLWSDSPAEPFDGYLYLRKTNLRDGSIINLTGNHLELENFSQIIGEKNKIYSNGYSPIYL